VVDEWLRDLVHWIVQQIEAGLTPDKILQTLLA
jgi:hypothetical protein